METEQELLARIREGNAQARHELYCRYAPQSMAVAMRYVADGDAARDVLQDAFVKILTSVSRFGYRGEGSLRAWVLRIVTNEAIDHVKERHKRLFTDALPDDLPDEEPDVGLVPLAALQHMMEQLPPGYRLVLNLYVFDQKSHREIARQLGIGESTSASQYHRAKRLLAKMIKDYLNRTTT